MQMFCHCHQNCVLPQDGGRGRTPARNESHHNEQSARSAVLLPAPAARTRRMAVGAATATAAGHDLLEVGARHAAGQVCGNSVMLYVSVTQCDVVCVSVMLYVSVWCCMCQSGVVRHDRARGRAVRRDVWLVVLRSCSACAAGGCSRARRAGRCTAVDLPAAVDAQRTGSYTLPRSHWAHLCFYFILKSV